MLKNIATLVVSIIISTTALAESSYSRLDLYAKRPDNSFNLIDSDNSEICNKYLSAINKERDFIKRNEFSFQEPKPKSEMDLAELIIQTELNAPRRVIPKELLGLGGVSRYEQFTIKTSNTSRPFYAIRSTGSRGGGWIHSLFIYQKPFFASAEGRSYREFRDHMRDDGLRKDISIDWSKIGTSRALDMAARDIGFNSRVIGGVVEIIELEARNYFVRTSAYIRDDELIDIMLFEIDKKFEATPICYLQSNFVVTKS
jgi:hypothetical protein